MDNKSNNKFLKIIGTLGLLTGATYYTIQVVKYILLINFSFKIIFFLSSIFFLLTIYFTILIYSKFTKNIGNDYLTKGWFLIIYLLISFLNIGISAYFLGNGSLTKYPNNSSKKNRVVLLLPLNENFGTSYQDGIRQVLGFAEYLKNNPDCTDKIEFALYDHNMKASDAEKIIREEIGIGTKYFISTMSSVNLELSKKFPEIVKSFNLNGQKPKLICAITSAPSVSLNSDLVYRYYIRSQEEAKALAKIGKEKGIVSATYIAIDNDYGKGAVNEFKNNWSGTITDGIFIDINMSLSDIEKEIQKKILIIPSEKRKAIFICHYGNGIDNTITALSNLKITSTILATSTLSIEEWQKPIINILDKMEWYTCLPDYNSIDKKQNDVIKNFTTYAIDKLVLAIKDTSFNYSWRTSKSPLNLETEWRANDFVIPMKAVYKSEFNTTK